MIRGVIFIEIFFVMTAIDAATARAANGTVSSIRLDRVSHSWLQAFARLPRSKQRARFKRLPIEDQIDYAVFRVMTSHPPDPEWATEVAHNHEKSLPLIVDKLKREKNDRVAVGLIELLLFVSHYKEISGDGWVISAINERINKISESSTRRHAEYLREQIVSRAE
jgi:hypothetical protein